MWRKSNTIRCLSTCLKILGNNTTDVKLASVHVESHDVEIWPIRITEDLVYYYKYICKYTPLNQHQFIPHNMNFLRNIFLGQQHSLPFTNKGTYPLLCTSDGVTCVGLIPGRLHPIESSLTWKYKDVHFTIKMQISKSLKKYLFWLP